MGLLVCDTRSERRPSSLRDQGERNDKLFYDYKIKTGMHPHSTIQIRLPDAINVELGAENYVCKSENTSYFKKS